MPQFIALALLSSAQIACGEAGSGHVVDRFEEMESFHSVSISDSFDAQIRIGEKFEVLIWADDNIIDDVSVKQEGNKVSVSLPHQVRNATLRAVFTLPELRAVMVSDSSRLEGRDLVFKDALDVHVRDSSLVDIQGAADEGVDELDLTCSDSSNCGVELDALWAIASCSDSSRLDLKGSGQRLELSASDSSSVEGGSFAVDQVFVSVSDSSFASVRASERVEGAVSDSSNLRVRGDADIDVTTRGSSSVERD